MKLESLKCWARKHQKFYAFLWGMPLYRKAMSCVHNRLNRHIDRESLSGIGSVVRGADMFLSLWIYGCSYAEYNLYGFSELSHRERRKYIGDCCRKKYYMMFNSVADVDCFRNKNEAYRVFQKFYGRRAEAYRVEEGLERFQELIHEYGTAMVKPATASGGYGVTKVTDGDSAVLRKCYEELCAYAPQEELIIEEYVKQTPELKALHPASLNTARIITILDKNAQPHILGAFFRIGVDGNVVDNGAAGGILCQLNKDGVIQRCLNKNGTEYVYHPNTGLQLVGFQIPHWEKALNLALELAKQQPNIRFCGWDLALSDQGWIMIEGNESSEFIGLQIFREPCKELVYRYI